MSTLTPTQLAKKLGITREVFPELWKARRERVCINHVSEIPYCTLLMPDSTDPRACLWEPFLMRALQSHGWWPVVSLNGTQADSRVAIDDEADFYGATPTAALFSAWLAQQEEKG